MKAAVAGTITNADAERRLVALGYDIALAREQIFIAFGGDDVVLDDAQRLRNIEASRP